MERKISTFDDYWPDFLKSHSKALTRKWHFWSGLMIIFAPVAAVIKASPGPAILLIIAGLLTAWYSHFVIEENKPTTWTTSPVLAVKGNVKMFSLMITSKLDEELKKYHIESK